MLSFQKGGTGNKKYLKSIFVQILPNSGFINPKGTQTVKQQSQEDATH